MPMGGSSSSCCQDPPKRKREDAVSSPNHATDQISQLPLPILHHILSFLPTKDVVRTSLLSKTWHHTSTSLTISVFKETMAGHARGSVAMEEWRPSFVKFVRNSLRSQCRIYGKIPKFGLFMTYHSLHASCIEDCVLLATQNNVKLLDIELDLREHLVRFILPQTLFSAKELIQLRLCGCHLSLPPAHGVSTWPFLRKLCLQFSHVDEHIIQNPTWPFLRKLCLQFSHVDEHIIQNLTFSCPLLEALFLDRCVGFGDIRLSGFTKLTRVYIGRAYDDSRAITFEVDVPSVTALSLTISSLKGSCNVNLTASKNLTKLTLRLKHSSQRFSTQDLAELISRFPALKTLLLDLSLETMERIRFLSQVLENLTLVSLDEFEEVSIDAPSLKTFKCSGEMLPCDFFMGRSSPQKVTINFFCDSADSFFELRKFLGGFQQIKVLNLFLMFYSLYLVDVPIASSALPDVKHLRVNISPLVEDGSEDWPLSRGDCLVLLDGCLWSCHPESLSFELSSCGKLMTKLFCEELSEMVKGQHCCKDNEHIRCWRHELRNFQIKQSGRNGDSKGITCDALLELLPTLASGVEIKFMLEW